MASTVLDQQFIAHLYAPTDGPDAEAAARAVREIWRRCRLDLGMTEPVPGLALPQFPSADLRPPSGVRDGVVALQEMPGADCQAVLRRHHDVLNLSVALAPPEAASPDSGGWSWWRRLDARWHDVVADLTGAMLGEARLHLARSTALGAAGDAREAPEGLFEELRALMPAAATLVSPVATPGIPLGDGLVLWEPDPQPDGRPLRRLMLAAGPGGDAAASSWAWSDGHPGMPPLARYLLHTAKLRFELRVWERDGQARALRDSLDALSGELVRLGAGGEAEARLLRLRGQQTALLAGELRLLRQAVEIAADNLGRVLDRPAPRTRLMAPGGPFADDADLAASFLERLDDQIAALTTRMDTAGTVLSMHTTSAPDRLSGEGARTGPRRAVGWRSESDAESVAARDGESVAGTDAATDAGTDGPTVTDPDGTAGATSRRVFVIHGRDEPARVAVWALLEAFGLHPVDWDESVAETGEPMPFLGQVLDTTIRSAQAVVVVMTPDDVVRLHPDLHGPSEPVTETRDAMQARPSVLVELGMALVAHRTATVMLVLGDHRPIADLGGRNYVRVAEDVDFRTRLGNRLLLAGCPVQMPEEGPWRTAGDFAALAAYRRRPTEPR